MEDSGGLKELKVVEQSLHLEVAGPVAWGWGVEGEQSTTRRADCWCCYWLVKVCHILYKIREGFKYCLAEYIFEEKVLQKQTTKSV